jgi:hypothetical protein
MKVVAYLGYGLTLEKNDSKYYLVLYKDREHAILLKGDWLDWAKHEEGIVEGEKSINMHMKWIKV